MSTTAPCLLRVEVVADDSPRADVSFVMEVPRQERLIHERKRQRGWQVCATRCVC